MEILNKLQVNPKNPRRITAESFERLKQKIKRNPNGLKAHKIVHKNGVIYAGNQRFRALQQLANEGFEVKDEYFIDATDWTDEQIREYIIISNINDGEHDWDLLSQEDIWSKEELEEWGLDLGDWKREEVEEDEAPEVSQEPAISELGKVYQLGRHRLMCGDATKIEDVEKLMDGQKADMVFTDPPYGMFLDTAMSARQTKKDGWTSNPKHYDKVIGDHDDFQPELITTIFDNFTYVKEIFIFSADYFAELLPGKNDGSWVVWDKRAGVEDMEWSTSEFELCWSKQRHQRKIARVTWSGILGTEQEHDHSSGRKHPTQKPVKLATWFFNKWGKSGDAVVDLYGGAGFTMLACEQTNRICYMMELDPKYCDVIRKRYWKFVNNGDETGWEENTPQAQL